MIDVETIFDSDREEYEFMQDKKEQPMKEQIEEIFNDVVEAEQRYHEYCLANTCHDCEYYGDGECDNHIRAEHLYNAGYRKVIHCKDCAYRDTEGCPNTYWNGGELESNVEDDSFCSVAKMKGGAE